MTPSRRSASLPGRSVAAGLALRLSLLVALLGLFLPSIGPILDHHFAERQHNHAHVYLSSRASEHVHFYDDGHTHVHASEKSRASYPNLTVYGPGTDEIIYLTANDGVGQVLVSLAATTLHVAVVYPVLGNDHFLLGFTSQDTRPPEAFVPPLERPPQI